MSRVQLALNVADLDASIEFYTKLFHTAPAKIRDGYANFAIADPPLKLVLFTGMGEPGSLNHIGVEVESTDEVAAVIARTQDDRDGAEDPGEHVVLLRGPGQDLDQGSGERLGVLHRARRRPAMACDTSASPAARPAASSTRSLLLNGCDR